MSINLVTRTQENLGYPALLKMDANTEEVMIDTSLPAEDRFSQAAIPAVFISLYKFTRTDEAAQQLLRNENVTDWMEWMRQESDGQVISVVADYAGIPPDEARQRMHKIAGEAVRLILETIGKEGTVLELKTLVADQRGYFLPYLPSWMQLGTLLDDSTLDDQTHKMQGPVSGLMHFIGNKLAGSDTDGPV